MAVKWRAGPLAARAMCHRRPALSHACAASGRPGAREARQRGPEEGRRQGVEHLPDERREQEGAERASVTPWSVESIGLGGNGIVAPPFRA